MTGLAGQHGGPRGGQHPIAIIGLACRFPDADDAPALADLVLTGRRAFRRLPWSRPDRHGARAALLEGWRFDPAAFRITPAEYRAGGPAHWLALETAARALAAAGFPGGAGLPSDRAGIFLGAAIRGRATAGGVAADISSRLGCRGGYRAIDGGGASSLLSVTAAALALAAGELDIAVAGGVEAGLDPADLAAMGDAGLLAAGEPMRIYDREPAGFLPGEGCGFVVLMRAPDARAAGLPVYAELLGWGTASARPWPTAADPDSALRVDPDQVLAAMRQAYRMARVDPADVLLVEGAGTGLAAADEAELLALTSLREGSRQPAALGSITANIGYAGAAAGVAGLIKTVLALGNGVLPATTGVRDPHPLASGQRPELRLPGEPAEWTQATRLAAVNAIGPDLLAAHLVLRSGSGRPARSGRDRQHPGEHAGSRLDPGLRLDPGGPATTWRRMAGERGHFAFLFQAPDRAALAALLSRVAKIGPWLSDSEFADLAIQLSREPAACLPARAGLVATGQQQLAALAREVVSLLPGLSDGLLAVTPGIFTADQADGRVTLLLSGQVASTTGDGGDLGAGQPGPLRAARPGRPGRAGRRSDLAPDSPPGPVRDASGPLHGDSLAILRWLDKLGVAATAAVGYGTGELAGLAWAGCTTAAGAGALATARAAALAGPGEARERMSQELAALALECRSPRRRLIPVSTGTELTSAEDILALLQSGLDQAAPVLTGPGPTRPGPRERLERAVAAGAVGASLLLEIGSGGELGQAAIRACQVPVVSLRGSLDDEPAVARAAAALFAAGAIGHPTALYAGYPGRQIDIWRDLLFIGGPGPAPSDWTSGSGAQSGARSAARPPRQRPAGPAPWSTTRPSAAPSMPPLSPVPAPAVQAPPIQAPPIQAPPIQAPAVEAPTVQSPSTAPGLTPPGLTAPGPTPPRPAPPRPAPPSPAPPSPAPPRPAPPLPAPPRLATGIAPWACCYAERLRQPVGQSPPPDDRSWRIFTGGIEPYRSMVAGVFRHDPAAGRTLAVLGPAAAAGTLTAALAAIRDSASTGELVVISDGTALSGLWASLHAERPELGLTVLRAPLSLAGLAAAGRVATARPGTYLEYVITGDGGLAEPVMRPVPLTGGAEFPLGPDDVVLLNREAGPAGLALAQVLACSGAAVALIGRSHGPSDAAMIGTLEQLRSAGARVSYEIVETTDPEPIAAAIGRIATRLGSVTAVAHAVGVTTRQPVSALHAASAQAELAGQLAGLEQLIQAVRSAGAGPRLIATFGSVARYYPLAEEGMLALASGALADRGRELAAGIPGCRSLHVDWPAWSGDGLGERPDLARRTEAAGFAPMPVTEGSRLLLKVLATAGLPDRLAIHGRVGVSAPRLIARAAARRPVYRFCENVVTHYPGVELIAQARLAMRPDPYLADYRIGQVPVLPPAMALEAMAEAAAVLAGVPLRTVRDLTVMAPVVLPGGTPDPATLIRICALADADTIKVALRCEASGFAVDHVRASFRVPGGRGGDWRLGRLTDDPPPRGITHRYPPVPGPGAPAAGSPAPDVPLPDALAPDRPAPDPPMLDATAIYGPICFQAGRFRKLTALYPIGPDSAMAAATGTDELSWFGPAGVTGQAAVAEPVLGSPGLADAALQLVQVLLPRRRLALAGCDRVTFSGRRAGAEVTVSAVRRPAAGSERAGEPVRVAGSWPAGPQVPAPREAGDHAVSATTLGDEPADSVWDVVAADRTGVPLMTWRGLRMRDAGPLPGDRPWPLPLLAGYLERAGNALGLGPGLEVRIGGHQAGTGAPGSTTAGAAGPGEDTTAADGTRRGAWAQAAGTGTGLSGLSLHVRAAGPAACSWVTASQPPLSAAGSGAPHPSGGTWRFVLGGLLAAVTESPALAEARVSSVLACLAATVAAPDLSRIVLNEAGDGWLVLTDGHTTIASVVLRIAGIEAPVALALLAAAPPAPVPAGPPIPGQLGRPIQAPAS